MKSVRAMRMRWAILALGVGALQLASAYFGLVWAPSEARMGEVYRILFVHAPAGWCGMLAFTVAFFASVVCLWRRSLGADAVASASVELGLLFSVVMFLTGMLWAKPVWGAYWVWDPRLVTALLMILLFWGYLALRALIDEPLRRAFCSAVFCLFAYADVPLTFMAVRWWRSVHGVVIRSPFRIELHPKMGVALLVGFLAWTLTYLALLLLRLRLSHLEMSRARPPFKGS